MAKNAKKTIRSSDLPFESSKFSEDKLRDALAEALAAEDDVRVLEMLDAAPRWINTKPEFMLIRASMLLATGDDQSALQFLRQIERKNPRFTPVYLPLALLYMENEWPAHALQAAKHIQPERDLDDVSRGSLAQVMEEATTWIQRLADRLSLPFETAQRTCVFHERAQMVMDEDKLSEADSLCREAIKVAPAWNAPLNTRAQALYFSGKVDEAVSLSKTVLDRDPENTFALTSLVTYTAGLNLPEQARDYGNRLEKLIPQFPADGPEMEQTIAAFALLEDTPALWNILLSKRYLNTPSDSLTERSWVCLLVAAIRNEKWKEAQKLTKKLSGDELAPAAQAILDEITKVASQRHPRLAWMPPAYPGSDLFFQSKVMTEWDALVLKLTSPMSPSQKRLFEGFFQKYPFIVTAMKRLLWDQTNHSMALEVLFEMDRADADEEILRFALSQTGSLQIRSRALMLLMQSERYTGPKIVRLWDEDREEWHEMELNTQRIGDVAPNARPETMEIVERARNTKNPQEAIALLRKAVEMEPTSPIAIFNLGVMLFQNGKKEEGEQLFRHSVEVDPNYTYGHASIALAEANRGHEQEALAHLKFVTQADVIAPDTAVVSNLAWFLLAMQKRDMKSARRYFDLAFQINPDHYLVKSYENTLKQAETFSQVIDSMQEYQRKSIERANQKLLRTPLSGEMGLRACLETNAKELLVGMANFLSLSPIGKKGELVSRLAENLLDPEFLRARLNENMVDKEREALRWLLEADGVRPWDEFISAYGDEDKKEQWTARVGHEPKTIPGRLRMTGLFYSGLLNSRGVAFIPVDVRPLLRKILL
jgi:tetratricopeptide (TPR) repeat protein